jgi:DNA-binding FadR family transcriptional regulator
MRSMPIRKNQLADQVMRQLRRLITSGKFAVDERLPSEPQLMKEFGVGRTTIREAVRVLAHSGLLEVRQGSGTYARAASTSGDLVERLRNARVREVYQVRRALEVEVVRAAAIARNQEDLATMRATLDRLHEYLKKGAREAFLEADMEMYSALAASTKNTVLIDFCRSFAQALKGALTQVMVFPGVMKSCVARHERVYQALVDGDPKVAQLATAQFLERVSSLIEDLLGNDSRIGDPAAGTAASAPNDATDARESSR